MKALSIQNDIGSGNYDATLAKYKSKRQLEHDRPTVLGLFKQFMEYKSKSIIEKTLEKYRATLGYLERHFTDDRADQIGESQAEAFSQYLKQCNLSADQRKHRLEELKAYWK